MATYYWVGGSGTWDNTNTASWSASSGGAGGAGPPNATDTAIIDGNSGSGTVTTAATAAAAAVTLNSATIGLTFGANFTQSGTFTLTAGTLDLGTFTHACLAFSSSNANTRSIVFGSGAKIQLTGTVGTLLVMATLTNFSYTGTSRIEATGNPSSGTRTFQSGNTAGGSATTAMSLYILGGTTGCTTDIYQHFTDLYFDSAFTGARGLFTNNIYGNLTFSSGMTVNAGASVTALVGTGTVTTNGISLDIPVTVSTVGGTITLADNMTIGTTRQFILQNGTLNVNGKTLTVGNFRTNYATTRVLAFGTNGKVVITGSGATAWNALSTAFTTSGTNATISMTSASAKTFVGAGVNYAATLSQDGAGALTITGSNTFVNITNTTQPVTITFTAGTTQTVSSFTASGTSGNLVTLNSATPGTRFTLSDSSGSNTVTNCSIIDSIGTGGATWTALTSSGNVNSGNNLGWIFSEIPVTYAQTKTVRLRSLAQRGRF